MIHRSLGYGTNKPFAAYNGGRICEERFHKIFKPLMLEFALRMLKALGAMGPLKRKMLC